MKPLKNVIWTGILIFAISINGIAQTSANSIPTAPATSASNTPAADLLAAEREIARLIADVRAGRKLSAEQEAEIAALEERLKAEIKNSGSFEKSYESAKREIASLRVALDFAQQAITAEKELSKELKSQRDEARGKAKEANKRAALAGAAGVIIVLAKIFLF